MPTVATAGHVDHGKSTLVRALTGTDPDRLAEEQRRGLTIDLGFAHLTLPSGRRLGIVDVPGHERYLTNMLAGAGGVRTCLLVVAADEGWRAQTEEHLRVVELLGAGHVVVALSRMDLVDAGALADVRRAVDERLASSALEVVDVVAVDARRGDGVAAVAQALDRLVDAAGEPPDRDRARLWIDRSFALPGAGTVVTGTLADGRLRTGDRVEVAGRAARIRSLQHHHGPVDAIGPGERVAVNLAGPSHRDVGRGHAVVAPGRWHHTAVVDARLDVLDDAGAEVSRRGAWTLHVGTAHQPVRLRVLGPDALPAGGSGPVRLHLSSPLPLVVGDRFVLRESGRDRTVGGGTVLDVAPVVRASRARPDGTLSRLVAERGAVPAEDLERWTGRPVTPTVGRWVLDDDERRRRTDALEAALRVAGPSGVELAGLDGIDRELVATLEGVELRAGTARPAGGAAAPSPAAAAWLASLADDPLGGAGPDGVAPEEVARLRRDGVVVRLDGVWFGADALQGAVSGLAELLDRHPDGAGVAAVRAALGGSRRTVIPFLTWCDGQGLTRRRGDVRVPGPRLAAAGPAGPPAGRRVSDRRPGPR